MLFDFTKVSVQRMAGLLNNDNNRNCTMSNTNNDTSDIKKAANQADDQQIEKNLNEDKKVDAPEELSKEEQTSFIDDELRTDK
jgi:hypothetical protein